jgi:hypothetical protein
MKVYCAPSSIGQRLSGIGVPLVGAEGSPVAGISGEATGAGAGEGAVCPDATSGSVASADASHAAPVLRHCRREPGAANAGLDIHSPQKARIVRVARY